MRIAGNWVIEMRLTLKCIRCNSDHVITGKTCCFNSEKHRRSQHYYKEQIY